jgi:hypothetical protein
MVETGGRWGLLLTGLATGGITGLYYTIGGFFGWLPFGHYPAPASLEGFTIYIGALIFALAISLLAYRGLHRNPSRNQAVYNK